MEIAIYILAVLAIAPPLLMAVYIYDLNRNGQTDLRACLQLMAYGALAVFPIVMVETITMPLFAGDGLFIQMLLGVALVEEGFKFLVIKRFVYDKGTFSAPIDGIVYAVMVGLGFALIENLRYVIQFGFWVGVIRMLTAVPMHAICGVLLGYFIGRAKLEAAKEKQLIAAGIASAVLLHGIYNFTAGISVGFLPLFIILGFGFYYANSMVHKGQTVSLLLEKLSIPHVNNDDVEKTAASNPNSSSQTIIESKLDEIDMAPEFYEKAYNELELGETNPGIWAMAYAKSSNEEDAKKKYITLRALGLAEEANKKDAKDEQNEIDSEQSEIKNKQEIESEQEVEESEEELVKQLPDLIHWAEKNSYIVESDGAKHRIRKEPLGKFRHFDNDLSFVNHLRDLRSAKL